MLGTETRTTLPLIMQQFANNHAANNGNLATTTVAARTAPVSPRPPPKLQIRRTGCAAQRLSRIGVHLERLFCARRLVSGPVRPVGSSIGNSSFPSMPQVASQRHEHSSCDREDPAQKPRDPNRLLITVQTPPVMIIRKGPSHGRSRKWRSSAVVAWPHRPHTVTFATADLLDGTQAYVLTGIEHATRRIRILAVTLHPTGEWTATRPET